ncbi:MAG: hypothetical protein ACJAXA_000681 [Candidatus Aldehydirespiratoraceae bacterium]|jgi:hypothetical protein
MNVRARRSGSVFFGLVLTYLGREFRTVNRNLSSNDPGYLFVDDRLGSAADASWSGSFGVVNEALELVHVSAQTDWAP